MPEFEYVIWHWAPNDLLNDRRDVHRALLGGHFPDHLQTFDADPLAAGLETLAGRWREHDQEFIWEVIGPHDNARFVSVTGAMPDRELFLRQLRSVVSDAWLTLFDTESGHLYGLPKQNLWFGECGRREYDIQESALLAAVGSLRPEHELGRRWLIFGRRDGSSVRVLRLSDGDHVEWRQQNPFGFRVIHLQYEIYCADRTHWDYVPADDPHQVGAHIRNALLEPRMSEELLRLAFREIEWRPGVSPWLGVHLMGSIMWDERDGCINWLRLGEDPWPAAEITLWEQREDLRRRRLCPREPHTQ
ncbi:MAG: hypothetical protein ACR2OZ_07865 [Verrucomicrobiales bacterium]